MPDCFWGDHQWIRLSPFGAGWKNIAREIYVQSNHCRAEEFDFHLCQIRGLFLLYRLAELFNQHEWKANVRYQRGWAQRFTQHPAIAEAEIISLFEKTGVLDLAQRTLSKHSHG